MKLNLGCGNDIKSGWINVDCAALPGVDVVHDLNKYPWPFEDGQFDEITARDVLEHLDEFIPAMEELYRISKPGARIFIEVPFWNSFCTVSDPTHKRGFNEIIWEFFDPDKACCKLRPYYSHARFQIISIDYFIEPFAPFYPVYSGYIRNKWLKYILKLASTYFSNVITNLQVRLERC